MNREFALPIDRCEHGRNRIELSANTQELSQDSATENTQFFSQFFCVCDLALGLIGGGLQPALSLRATHRRVDARPLPCSTTPVR